MNETGGDGVGLRKDKNHTDSLPKASVTEGGFSEESAPHGVFPPVLPPLRGNSSGLHPRALGEELTIHKPCSLGRVRRILPLLGSTESSARQLPLAVVRVLLG